MIDYFKAPTISQLAKEINANARPREKKKITIDDIQKEVCNYFNLNTEQLHNNTRKRETVQARQIAMFFSKNLTNRSLATIGTQIGGKDHATVLHACKTVNNLIETDKHFRKHVDQIEQNLKKL